MRFVSHVILGLVGLVALCLVVAAVTPPIQAAVALHQLKSSDPAVRKKGLLYVRDERIASAAPILVAMLNTESVPGLVELSGSALMRMRDLSALPALQSRADREQDPALKARLIYATARLADRDYRILDWLLVYAHSSEPWLRAAGCVGLLQLGRLEGGDLLLKAYASLSPEPQDYALQEFRRIVDPIGQTVGSPVTWPKDSDPQRIELSWRRLGDVWNHFATLDLLSDVLMRLERSDAGWRDVERILHARWYAMKWIH